METTAKIENVTVQKVMSLIRTVGLLGDPDMDVSKALEHLKTTYRMDLKDGSRLIVTGSKNGASFTYGHMPAELVGLEDVPTGDHAGTEDGTIAAFKSPAGTESLIIFKQMETMLEHGFRNDSDDDDDYEEDEDDEDDDDAPRRRHRLIKRATKSVVITPAIYFQFIKSKLEVIQQQELMDRLAKITALLRTADMLKQDGLYEELALRLSGMVKEQEAVAIGCGIKIPQGVVQHFINHVDKRTIKFCPFEQFPRAVPAESAEKIKRVQDTNVFDSLHILFVDYTGESFKSNHQKIKEKDPIVFGRFDFLPDTLYYVCDWVDEYCDLTLAKLVDALQVDDPTFNIAPIEEIDQAFVDRILKDVEDRKLRLKATNMSSYKSLMREEARAAERRREREEEAAEEAEAEALRKSKRDAALAEGKELTKRSFFSEFMNKLGNFISRKPEGGATE